MCLQIRLPDVEECTCPTGPREDVDVIQKREQDLASQKHCLRGLQSWALRKRKQASHQGVPLFPSFALFDDARCAVLVVPRVS